MKTKGVFKKMLSVLLVTAAMVGAMATVTGCGGESPDAGRTETKKESTKQVNTEPVTISLDEWPGWQSLLDANGGLETAPGSINARNGINVKYVVMNDATASSSALIAGDTQAGGYTVNRYSFLQDRFNKAGVEVVMPYITNFSNGGDGIISTDDITNVADLSGKTIGVPKYSEAHTIIEWLIGNSGLTKEEKDEIRKGMRYFETPDEAANAFFGGQIDAAATWEPYLTQATNTTGARILFDTSMSTNLVLDGLVFRKDFADKNEDFIVTLIDGALEAMPMYKKDFKAIREMPMFELMSDNDIIEMENGADLATAAQNEKLLTDTAIQMYRDMANAWIEIGKTLNEDIVAYPDAAEEAFTDKYIKQLLEKYPDENNGEKTFTREERDKIMESPDALLSYTANIQFDWNKAEVRKESYPTLDEFINVAKVLNGVYIQIEGHAAERAKGITDDEIKKFTEDRANAVKDYFINKGIEKSRIITVGKGDSELVNKESPTAEENRRTEIYFKTSAGQ